VVVATLLDGLDHEDTVEIRVEPKGRERAIRLRIEGQETALDEGLVRVAERELLEDGGEDLLETEEPDAPSPDEGLDHREALWVDREDLFFERLGGFSVTATSPGVKRNVTSCTGVVSMIGVREHSLRILIFVSFVRILCESNIRGSLSFSRRRPDEPIPTSSRISVLHASVKA
jgi:hypothetical protein